MEDARVKVRGIYATALTQRLATAGIRITMPSEPIADRFDIQFSDAVPTVVIEDTADEEGLLVSGEAEHVEAVLGEVRSIHEQLWTWQAATPPGSLFAGRVEETSEHGATVSLGGEREAFLPFGRSDEYVTPGDDLVVQVHDPLPPWDPDRRPVVSTYLTVEGTTATIGESIDRAESEYDRYLQLFEVDLPEDWGITWHAAVDELPLASVAEELTQLDRRARALLTARDRAQSLQSVPESVHETLVASWCWFGRSARFALDELRAEAVVTVPGHHRVKAGSNAGSTAVDFVEALGYGDTPFDIEAVLTTFGPTVGDRVRIEHGKPTGRTVVLGTGEVTARSAGGEVTIDRELTSSGTYDGLGTKRESGDIARSTFVEGRWWYPTVYRSSSGDVKGTYVNVGTPIEIFPDRVRYLDLHVDVIKRPEGDVRIIDRDELSTAVDENQIPSDVASRARQVAASIEAAL